MKCWPITSLLVATVVIHLVSGKIVLEPSSPHCKRIGQSLNCNFQDIQETVYLDKLETSGPNEIRKVFIHNTQDVWVSDGVCVALALFSVAKLTFSSGPDCSNDLGITLKMTDSQVNLVPRSVTSLEMAGSSAKEVICENDLKFIAITKSNIGLLRIDKPIKDKLVKIEHSNIDKLASLKVEGKAQLLLINNTIDILATDSLSLHQGANGNLWFGKVTKTLERAVTLGPQSHLSIRDVDGKITLAGPDDIIPSSGSPVNAPQEAVPPGVPPRQDIRLPPLRGQSSSSSLFWLFPTVVAILEAMIIIVNCTNWFPALKNGRPQHGVEEGGRRYAPAERVETRSQALPTWYYSNESSPSFTTTSRSRMAKEEKDA